MRKLRRITAAVGSCGKLSSTKMGSSRVREFEVDNMFQNAWETCLGLSMFRDFVKKVQQKLRQLLFEFTKPSTNQID